MGIYSLIVFAPRRVVLFLKICPVLEHIIASGEGIKEAVGVKKAPQSFYLCFMGKKIIYIKFYLASVGRVVRLCKCRVNVILSAETLP